MFRAFLDEARAVRDPAWGRWAAGDDLFEPSGPVVVNERTAPAVLAVYGSITQIADVMSTMPVDRYTRDSQGTRRELGLEAWMERPAPDVDWTTFMASCIWSVLLDGNVFIAVARGTRGRPVALDLLNPRQVTVERRDGVKTYRVGGAPFAGEILHIPLYVLPGEVRGLDPIMYAKTAIGGALAAQEFGAGVMGNNAVPAGIIEVPGELSDDQRKDLRENWARRHQGPRNAGRVGLLTGGAKFTQITMTPEQAQFIETRRFSATEIATNLFHVPPDMVGVAIEGRGITYQNLEHRWTEFIRRANMPLMARFERAFSYHLLTRPQYLKFNPDVYLRPDTKTRYEVHRIAIESGLAKPSERREIEDLEYLPESDVLYAPGASAGGAPATADQVVAGEVNPGLLTEDPDEDVE